MKELEIQKRIMLALSQEGCTVWRNATARAWVGRLKGYTSAGDAVISDAKQLLFGLAEGSSDLVGITPCGRFLAVEVKSREGGERDNQERFRRAVNRAGGIAYIARSPEEAVSQLYAANACQWGRYE